MLDLVVIEPSRRCSVETSCPLRICHKYWSQPPIYYLLVEHWGRALLIHINASRMVQACQHPEPSVLRDATHPYHVQITHCFVITVFQEGKEGAFVLLLVCQPPSPLLSDIQSITLRYGLFGLGSFFRAG